MLNRSDLCLLHGGHKGAEAAFGEVAEEWGVDEITLSFEDHKMERARNVETLTEDELAKGRVSLEFVFQRMGRRFLQGKGIRRVLKMMFQLVVRSNQVFVIGWIQPDDVVKGGTGWGVELAKVFNREVHVYDQERNGWYTWQGQRWVEDQPILNKGTVAATGTRNLTDTGRAAIRDLFERSLGKASATQSAGEQSR